MGRIADWITGRPPEEGPHLSAAYQPSGGFTWGWGGSDYIANADPGNYAWWKGVQLVPVRAAVEYIARQVGSADIRPLELKGGRWERLGDQYLPAWAREYRASTYQVRLEFLASLITHCLLGGNGYALITRYDGGLPAKLAATSPYVTSVYVDGKYIAGPRRDPSDIAAGNFTDGVGYSVGGDLFKPYDPEGSYSDSSAPSVLHMRRPGSTTGVVGESPLSEQAPTWRTGLAAEAHIEIYFASGGQGPGAFVHEGSNISKARLDGHSKAYADARSDPASRHMPAFMSGPWKWISAGMTPEQMQLIDIRKLTWNGASATYGVPLALMGAPGTENSPVLVQAKRICSELTIAPTLDHVSQVLSETVPPDMRLQLVPRMSASDRLETSREVQRLIDAGLITPNEGRIQYLELPPKPGGDDFTPRQRPGGQENNRGGSGEGRATPNHPEDAAAA